MAFAWGARVALGLALVFAGALGCDRIGPRHYEYDEQIDLALDGSAVVDVSGSVAALVALHGVDLDVSPTARLDRRVVRRLYEDRGALVTEVSSFRRHTRRFVHVRLEIDDIRRLPELRMFSWSRYQFQRRDTGYWFAQQVAPREAARAARAHRGPAPDVGWDGSELTAFRIHLPSHIQSDNSPEAVARGNILVWEQSLRDRLAGVPLRMEAQMDAESILSRTLWLFGGTFVLAMTMLALVVWWIARKGRSVVPA